MGDQTYAVVGVMPRGVRAPLSSEIWIAAPSDAAIRTGRYGPGSWIVTRLKDGLTLADVQPELGGVMRRLDVTNSTPDRPFLLEMHSLRPNPLKITDYHAAMAGAAGGILLIACLNVAALMLARGVVRRRLYALRLALGASRAALAREVLAEAFVVALIGGVAGALVSAWGLSFFTSIVPEEFTWVGIAEPAWNWRVFVANCVTILIAVTVAGGIPAWRASRVDPGEPLKDGAGTTTGRSHSNFRPLIISELALSMVLLTGASLMTKATRTIADYDFGYDARPLISAQFGLHLRRDSVTSPAASMLLVQNAFDRVKALPGVVSATMARAGAADNLVAVSDRTTEGGASLPLIHGYHNVNAGFFATLGIPIVRGRDFAEGDRENGGAIILDQSAAKILFPHDDPVGRLVKLGDLDSGRPWVRVIGVARDASLAFRDDPDLDHEPALYASVVDSQYTSGTIIIRPERGAQTVTTMAGRAMRGVFPARSYVSAGPYIANYAYILRSRTFLASVFAALGAVSIILAAVGLFSVLSYVVGNACASSPARGTRCPARGRRAPRAPQWHRAGARRNGRRCIPGNVGWIAAPVAAVQRGPDGRRRVDRRRGHTARGDDARVARAGDSRDASGSAGAEGR